jgi:C4-dicarboxylate-specific signal transduction histidine kinase
MGMKRLEECSVLRPNVSMSQLSCRISSVAAEGAIALEITRLDRQVREVHMELAHANRVATMGQLTASIVHEVNQPITATMTNAQAALRFLDAQVVDLNEVRQILNDIVKDGNRAGEVVSRIRDLIKKAPPRREGCEISGAIREVIELTRGQAVKNGVSVLLGSFDRPDACRGLPGRRCDGDGTLLEQKYRLWFRNTCSRGRIDRGGRLVAKSSVTNR